MLQLDKLSDVQTEVPAVLNSLGACLFNHAKLLLKTETGITKMRGSRYHWWRDIILVPTFHPAAALRGGDRVTNDIRADLALVRDILDGRITTSAEPAVESPSELADGGSKAQLDLFGGG